MKTDKTFCEILQEAEAKLFWESRVNSKMASENNFLNNWRYTDTEGKQEYKDNTLIDHYHGMAYIFKDENNK